MRPITCKGGITGRDLPRVPGKVKVETDEQKKKEHRKRKVSTMSSDGFNMGESIKQIRKHFDIVLSEGIIKEDYLKRCTCQEWIQYMTYLKTFMSEYMTAVRHMVITMRYCPYCKTGLDI